MDNHEYLVVAFSSLQHRLSGLGLNFRVKESIGHTAALFLVVGMLTMLSSVVWLLMTVRQVATGRDTIAWAKMVKLGLALLAALLWVVLFAGPE